MERDYSDAYGDLETDEFDIPESTKGKHKVRICYREDEDKYLAWVYFTVKPKLEITEPDDAKGPVGTKVTVKGTGFDEDEKDIEIRYYTNSHYEVVKKDISANEYGSWGAEFTVPASSKGDHDILAEGDETDEDEVKEASFEVEPGISLSKESGYVGDTLTVTGSGFEEDEKDIKVSYDGDIVAEDIKADDDGAWVAAFKVPPSVKGKHEIDAYGKKTKAKDIKDKDFMVKPKIMLSPTEGYMGISVSVSGSGFAASQAVSIKYDAAQVATATSDREGSFSASFSAPEGVCGKHTMTAKDTSGNSGTAEFTTVPPKATLTPTEGHVGASLTLSSSGFAPEQAVTIKYDDAQVVATKSDSKGGLRVSFLAPKSIHGNHTVTAADALGNAVTLTFVMESTPPAKPALTAPANGSRVGFISSQTPKFEWQAIDDPSKPVSYNLQIATSPDFALLKLDKTGLSEASYTLSEIEALSYGTYYWRAKAIDSAQNDSGWTAPYSFKSGLLPLWAFIAIIALIVVLIGVLVYFFAIRKGISYD